MEKSFDLDESIESERSIETASLTIPLVQKDEIQEYIIEKLLSFYKYNKQLNFFLMRKYSTIKPPYFEEYYVINYDWFSKYLFFYNYKEIKNIIINYNGEIDLTPLMSYVFNRNIRQKSEEFPKEMTNSDLFTPKINQKEGNNFFTEFIILDKNMYNKINQDEKNRLDINYNFSCVENKVSICLVKNEFIYKINNYSFGIGSIKYEDKDDIPIIILDFLIILNEFSGYNSETEINEIFKVKSIYEYMTKRRIIDINSDGEYKKIFDLEKNEIGKFFEFNENDSKYKTKIKENNFINYNHYEDNIIIPDKTHQNNNIKVYESSQLPKENKIINNFIGKEDIKPRGKSTNKISIKKKSNFNNNQVINNKSLKVLSNEKYYNNNRYYDKNNIKEYEERQKTNYSNFKERLDEETKSKIEKIKKAKKHRDDVYNKKQTNDLNEYNKKVQKYKINKFYMDKRNQDIKASKEKIYNLNINVNNK